MSAEKPAATRALKASAPIGEWQPDPNLHAISRRRMRDDRRDAAHAIGSIDDRRFDRGVRQRDVRQTLAQARGREARVERLEWGLSGREQAGTASECCDEDGNADVQAMTPGVVVHGRGVSNQLTTWWQPDGPSGSMNGAIQCMESMRRVVRFIG